MKQHSGQGLTWNTNDHHDDHFTKSTAPNTALFAVLDLFHVFHTPRSRSFQHFVWKQGLLPWRGDYMNAASTF